MKLDDEKKKKEERENRIKTSTANEWRSLHQKEAYIKFALSNQLINHIPKNQQKTNEENLLSFSQ